MTYKRYQYYSKDGIVFTEWFKHNGPKEKKQLEKLKNEYKEV